MNIGVARKVILYLREHINICHYFRHFYSDLEVIDTRDVRRDRLRVLEKSER